MNLSYHPNDPAVLADPFPLYRRMRDEDPAHWSPLLKAWVLTRYEDVKRVCLDAGMSSDRLRPFFATLPSEEAARIAELIRVLTVWMVFAIRPSTHACGACRARYSTCAPCKRAGRTSGRWSPGCSMAWAGAKSWISSPTSPARCRRW
jgi:hypothetical protein